ncbi:MAG: RHS repeat-associated core domain-containing protein [Acidobacteriota bacterium]|nr:MAG: RHS repeat-associated core domain-containing protein [Acidobacteriota bacterium]
MTQRSYSDSTPAVSYFYDNLTNAKGRLTKVSSSVSTTEYTSFDILGKVTGHKQTTDGQEYATGYVYNLSGAMVEQVYPSGRVVKNVIDGNGDLSMVQSKKNSAAGYWNYAENFTYNPAGAVTSMQLGNGRWESTQFNSRLQPMQIALGSTNEATNLLKLDYSYGTTNNNGNVLSQTITVPTVGVESGFSAMQNYTYDSLNRLKTANEVISSTETWKQTFIFDRYGNRNFDESNTTTLPKSCMDGGNPVVCTADRKIFNPSVNQNNNRLNTSEDYTYDSGGNTTNDPQGRLFKYDGENKQYEVRNSSNETIGQYFFDGNGKRVKKVVPSTEEVTVFVYDAMDKLVAEYSTQVESVENAKVAYLTNDHLGSPRIKTDKNGAVISRNDYLPYGEDLYTAERTQTLGYSSDDIRQKFTGYERDDEIDLDFAQARYCNSGHGRFTSPDPILESAVRAEPQSWNRYVYVLNNPFRYIDPTGENYEDLTDKQKKLIDDWAKQQNEANKTEITAQKMYDALGEDQRAAFESVANALENTTLIGKDGSKTNGLDLIKSISFILGEKPSNNDDAPSFRIYAELTENAREIVSGATNFKGSNGHPPGFPDGWQQSGGSPGLQISMSKDGKRGDIDVDYQSKNLFVVAFTLCQLHCKESNSDVRHKNHFDKHNKRYGSGPAGALKRRYDPKKRK